MSNYSLAKHAYKLLLVLSLPILLLATDDQHLSSSSPPSCKFPAIFNFGDSNSDTGGWSAAFGRAGPPHGETFFHAPAGRYSDGRLIIDFVAESLGLPYLNAYLDSMGSNFSHGANFATAASTIRQQNTTSYSPFNLNVQYYQFYGFRQRSEILRNGSSELMKSILPRAEYFSQALYTFDIGQNDLTAAYFSLGKSTDQAKTTILDILDHLKTIIKIIYGEGGRYFWIHNTGPLGCVAYMLDGLSLNATQMDQTGCAISLNELAQSFNNGLKEAVTQLRKDMPQAAITYVDIYSIKYNLISQARKLGFEDPILACCGRGGKNNYDVRNRCGANIMEDGKQVLVGSCKDPSVRISWDGAHYTEAANKWVFDRLVNGSYSDPPTPLKMACNKQ